MNSKSSTRTDVMAHQLNVQMSWWAMTGLGENGREWSLEEKFQHIAQAGFNGINGALPAPDQADTWKRLLDRYGLSFSVNAYPKSAIEMEQFLAAVKQYGTVQYINAQVLTPFVTGQSAERLLSDIQSLSRAAGVPIYIETHRGTLTQDLMRTVQYASHLEALPLTIDFSHYVVAGEMRIVSDEAEALLQTLLARTSCIHARVSNGEQVQVSVGEQGEHGMMEHFVRWWRSGMEQWLKKAEPGEIFPFVCELGPPPYAITTDEYGGRRNEVSDRWSQSLLFARVARSIWQDVAGEQAT